MMKILFILLIFSLFACSGEDGDVEGKSEEGYSSSSSSEVGDSSSSSDEGESSSSADGGESSSSSETNYCDSEIYECREGLNGIYLKKPIEDSRDGQIYDAVLIGTQVWMAKNLNFKPNSGNSWCYGESYDEFLEQVDGGEGGQYIVIDPGKCDIYGRLYDWATAMNLPTKCNSFHSNSDPDCTITVPNHRGNCPEGYHVPNRIDWNTLLHTVDGSNTAADDSGDSLYRSPTAGKHLKAKIGFLPFPSGWSPYPGTENLDSFGFSALPSGRCDPNHNNCFQGAGSEIQWWSTVENNKGTAYYVNVGMEVDYAFFSGVYATSAKFQGLGKSYGYSVRCVRD